jgi:hypothetical protein
VLQGGNLNNFDAILKIKIFEILIDPIPPSFGHNHNKKLICNHKLDFGHKNEALSPHN